MSETLHDHDNYTQPARPNPFLMAAISIAVVVAAAAIGSLATFSGLTPWYVYLNKPFFTPPNWLFGPAWTVLYVMMAIAFYRILRRPVGSDATRSERGVAVLWFLVQITLNALWCVAFFGLRSPLLGLITIILLIAAILVTLLSFAKLDRVAAGLLVPYLGWVLFATALNAGVWWLNL